ncbi:hypothetical protein ABAC460_01760 [Asticcacaulis sp. AC460]|uniref:hypothetical protein n=1 Tax=Asticcacaulis sp. AC460 TaxID=1282360 RepID=UPI0003C3DC86|nr:hypothetical protein [Asticcacaulis sp. AC460]ESQ93003.1 hypothetical protein ABAC460_01760 [Asticcacaulis sp. AC460]
MKSKIATLKYYFLGLFVVISLGIVVWQLMYEFPRKKCEDAGNWWSYKYRQCAVPLRIYDMTGRKPGTEKPAAETTASQ